MDSRTHNLDLMSSQGNGWQISSGLRLGRPPLVNVTRGVFARSSEGFCDIELLMHQSGTVIWISINEKPPPMERMFACIADTIHVLRYCKGPPQQSHSDYWRDSFGAKTNINRIEDVIAWLGLFIYLWPIAEACVRHGRYGIPGMATVR
jgi:hypothetical protein